MQCRSCGREERFGDSFSNGICQNCRGGRQGRGVLGVVAGLLFVSVKLLALGNVGLLVVGLSVATIVLIGVALGGNSRPAHGAAELDQGPDGPEQVVGKACGACGEKIVSVVEAARCDKCGDPLHEECQHKHLVAAHSGSKKHPYRK
ncbi:MAG: hypothetical protein U0441_23700 [Polyangiaceae bacterium]